MVLRIYDIGFRFTLRSFLSLTALIPIGVMSQSEYRSGFIVTSNHDTIHGYIKADVDWELAEEIFFKKDLQSETVFHYDPQELQSLDYGSGRHLRSFKVTGNGSTKHILAKRISSGKIDMYVRRYRNRVKADYILRDNSTNGYVYLHTPRKKQIKNNGKYYNKTEKGYIISIDSITNGFLRKSNISKISFSQRNIQKLIDSYNHQEAEKYPMNEYEPALERHYSFSAGLPINGPSYTYYRLAFYRETMKTERSLSISTINGVTYRHSGTYDIDDSQISKQHVLSIIPFGIKFQSKSGILKSYGYIGGGIALNWNTRPNELENDIKYPNFFGYPTINLGGGIKIDTGPMAILMEITPDFVSGIMINLGILY
ncbi:hypothetical protein [Pareuzebyella sediminis]|uniref:hypothetical protein n=1 Tax=Pareuzebyella sediminis TaxID=2607998 RepID=UPI0011EED0D6|nr:hypothetical protein [Pareuzebyella sediminis]